MPWHRRQRTAFSFWIYWNRVSTATGLLRRKLLPHGCGKSNIGCRRSNGGKSKPKMRMSSCRECDVSWQSIAVGRPNREHQGSVPVDVLASHHAIEQISNLDLQRPFFHVVEIQSASLQLENAEDVAPLAIRNFVAESIPFQFRQHRVFGCGQENLDVG